MDDIKYCFLTDEKDIIEYEKGLYKAFYLKDPDSWVAKNYIITNNERLRSHIPYNDQKIYLIKYNNEIAIGMAVNLNVEKLQLVEMGFNVDQVDKNKKICEGINFFNIKQFNIEMLNLLNPFFKNAFDYIKELGYEVIYCTCNEDLLKFYKKFGQFKEIYNIKINGNLKFLLKRYL